MSDTKKPKYDMHSPEAKALTDEIVHGTFTKEGTMVAFPTCFPGASVPIAADESHITALHVSEDGLIYGGTGGRAAHIFVGMFHGVTGMVFDRGTIDGATQCAAIACGKARFLACVNGPSGGRVIAGSAERLPFDLIQEWSFARSPLQELGTVNHEPMVHAIADASRKTLVGITNRHLFTIALDQGEIRTVGEVSGIGRLAVGSKGGVFGRNGDAHLWRYDVSSGNLERRAVALPKGAWSNVALTWAKDPHNGLLYTADADGNLFSFDEQRGFSEPLARTQLTPVGPMAATYDGRVFGFCGADMAKMFCYNPRSREATNLGVAMSILERRRYGYVFGDAVTGRDGQIIFGEDDDLGHLWLYFPRIQTPA